MNYQYVIYKEMPDPDILDGISLLHESIFGTADNLLEKMRMKSELLLIVVVDGHKVIGFKIGYPIDQYKFYSWLGGVNPDYRNQGIATLLMEKQHRFLIDAGYKIVQTKTMNKWRSMLILNIKQGFDVIKTYTDEKGLHKIILEKQLVK